MEKAKFTDAWVRFLLKPDNNKYQGTIYPVMLKFAEIVKLERF